MMNDKNQTQEETSNKQNNSLSSFNARRRLIKGAAIAAPVVITLRSGAAMALTSQQCTVRDQKLANTTKPSKFKNNEGTFLRTKITIARLVRITLETDSTGNNPKYVFVKNSDLTLKSTVVYAHGHGLTLSTTQWSDTNNNQQNEFILQPDEVEVYDTYAAVAVSITAAHFKRSIGSRDFVLAKRNSDKTQAVAVELQDKFGLVVTDNSGVIQNDILTPPGPRVGKFTDNEELTANNHITGSCWTSVNPSTT